jgi:hypothetical protein
MITLNARNAASLGDFAAVGEDLGSVFVQSGMPVRFCAEKTRHFVVERHPFSQDPNHWKDQIAAGPHALVNKSRSSDSVPAHWQA